MEDRNEMIDLAKYQERSRKAYEANPSISGNSLTVAAVTKILVNKPIIGTKAPFQGQELVKVRYLAVATLEGSPSNPEGTLYLSASDGVREGWFPPARIAAWEENRKTLDLPEPGNVLEIGSDLDEVDAIAHALLKFKVAVSKVAQERKAAVSI